MDLAAIGWPGVCGAAIALGARHALDADHLTVIDGIARRNVGRRPAVAQCGGMLFSLGHVAVVAFVALATATWAAGAATPPAWLTSSGLAISAIVLLMLGVLNLRAAWIAAPGADLSLVGWKSRLATGCDHPLAIIVTGALFAISLDTIAIAFGLGLTGRNLGGLRGIFVSSICFAIGMIVTGGANGAWIVQLLRSTSRHSALAMRLMTGAIGLLNLALALLAIATLLCASMGDWREDNGLIISMAVFGLCGLAFVIAHKLGALESGPDARRNIERKCARTRPDCPAMPLFAGQSTRHDNIA